MTAPREADVCALMTLVKYVIHTEKRGLVLAPNELWSTGYKFKIHGWSDSENTTNPDDQRSISGGRVFVSGTLISFHSITQKFVMLSMTNAEIVAGVIVAHNVIYIYHLMEPHELQVELPMTLERDNSRAVDITNSWSVWGRTSYIYIDMWNYSFHELNDHQAYW